MVLTDACLSRLHLQIPLSAGAVLLQDCDDNLFSTYYWVELPVGSGCGKVRPRLRALASNMS